MEGDRNNAAFSSMCSELHSSLGDFPGSNDRLVSCRLVMRNAMKAGDIMVVAEDHLVGMTVRYVLPRAAH